MIQMILYINIFGNFMIIFKNLNCTKLCMSKHKSLITDNESLNMQKHNSEVWVSKKK